MTSKVTRITGKARRILRALIAIDENNVPHLIDTSDSSLSLPVYAEELDGFPHIRYAEFSSVESAVAWTETLVDAGMMTARGALALLRKLTPRFSSPLLEI